MDIKITDRHVRAEIRWPDFEGGKPRLLVLFGDRTRGPSEHEITFELELEDLEWLAESAQSISRQLIERRKQEDASFRQVQAVVKLIQPDQPLVSRFEVTTKGMHTLSAACRRSATPPEDITVDWIPGEEDRVNAVMSDGTRRSLVVND